MWGVYSEVLMAYPQNNFFFPILFTPFLRKFSKTTFLATIFKIVRF